MAEAPGQTNENYHRNSSREGERKRAGEQQEKRMSTQSADLLDKYYLLSYIYNDFELKAGIGKQSEKVEHPPVLTIDEECTLYWMFWMHRVGRCCWELLGTLRNGGNSPVTARLHPAAGVRDRGRIKSDLHSTAKCVSTRHSVNYGVYSSSTTLPTKISTLPLLYTSPFSFSKWHYHWSDTQVPSVRLSASSALWLRGACQKRRVQRRIQIGQFIIEFLASSIKVYSGRSLISIEGGGDDQQPKSVWSNGTIDDHRWLAMSSIFQCC